jgi:alpha-L-rhamnosidase
VDVSLATMAGYGERRLTRKAIREFVASQARYWPDGRLNAVYPNGDGARDIPDYTEMFPGWVWAYYLQSGDAATLKAAYPVMRAIADYVRRYVDPSTGLVTRLAGGSGAYVNGIIDWPNRYGYDTAATARTTVNILGVDVLKETAQAAAALGESAGTLEEDAKSLTTAINARLRRTDGVYIDGLEADGAQSAHASQIANAYALAYGLTSDRVVTDHVAGLGLQMSPMTVHLLMAALAGRPDRMVERLTDPNGIGWARILASGGTFMWESWEAPETGDSLSHGWGSTPLVDVQQSLLGVAVTAPGAAEIRVRPPASGLTWASGTVPTQRGDVSVAWRRHGGRTTVSVSVPVNVRAEVDLPAGRVRVSGEARPEGHGVYSTGSGHVTFTVT